MSAGLYVGYSGAATARQQLDSIANNIANISTAGFRRDQTRFDTVVGAALNFARAPETNLDLSPGSNRLTGDPLNAALEGDGFFAVQGADGQEYYTRRGDFRLDARGRLVLPNGQPVLGNGGELIVPDTQKGTLTGDGRLTTDLGEAGRLRVVRFQNPEFLAKAGESLISAPPEAGLVEVDNPALAVGFVEDSNVNVAAEMVSLIESSRVFEAAMRSITINDELTQRLIQSQAS
jgi:flagellar basal body rod protein FlgG